MDQTRRFTSSQFRLSRLKGDTTNPTGRIFPRRIIPWDDFKAGQEEIWDQLSNSCSFASRPVFPSPHQLDYVMSLISPISSETDLRNFQRDTVENAVQKLVDEAYSNTRLRSDIGLQGTVTFESRTNLGRTDGALSEAIDHISTERNETDAAAIAPRPLNRKSRRRARGKGNRADQFCIYRTSDGRNIPAVDGEGFAFASRSLVAAVYRYVCTGEAIVFLNIPDDPTIIYYSLRVPNLDFLDDDENELHGTAVAQALRAEPPLLSCHDAAVILDTWAEMRKDKEARPSPYKSQGERGFQRSPIWTQSAREEAQQSRGGRQHSQGTHQNIKGRPSCTTQCLFGLANFLRLVRTQLTKDRGPDADVVPRHLSGSIGSLFKLRLSRYGYTHVAKGVETLHLARVCHENEVHDRLRPIQGKHVPLCLGRIHVLVLFLSWAGTPLFDSINRAITANIDAIAETYKIVDKLGVIQGDAKLYNVLRDTASGCIMIVDFERAEVSCRPPLGFLTCL
ncbi:hypothetical protein BDP81DRAFT_512054 [Colletotrichum phormii]|uniref:Protein kinase domain-containing protein n=1 Tax=Colletotrichum phormii TaxID=359342 RepID=A0AAI9ZC52_9PEZI|nr:uncharacterized protein BDP81DRAFT_512054 [Colletotrichum phormii]KAK1621508.1 hypothetical protein BDP81DRAFT_512054 [Colletotrichum phormii]